MDKNHYKDRPTYETIRLMKDFLLKRNILTYEKWYMNNGNMYSLCLTVNNTGISVNGKGINKELALASAYGELAERLFTYAPFRLKNNIYQSDPKLEKGEYMVSENELDKLIEAYLAIMLIEKTHRKGLLLLIKRFSEFKGAKEQYKIIQYNSIRNSEILRLPVDLVDLFYGTNGMAAGNTKEEAIVQGLSEILERYVIHKCIKDRISPPDLNNGLLEKLENYYQIRESIFTLEQSKKYSVIIKDLSLGHKIPAVGVILLDIRNRAYLVKIGVHPKIEIALERCFTELMQGHNIDNYSNIMLVRECFDEPSDSENICQFYVDSHAHLPIEFFINASSSYEPLVENNKYESNIDMCKYLVDLIYQMGYEIFIHDFTRMELNCVQILVPNMSEFGPVEEDHIKYVNEQYKINHLILKGIENLTKKEIKTILSFINRYITTPNIPVSDLILSVRFNKRSIYQNVTISLFKFMLYMLIEDEEGALETIQKYNMYLRNIGKESRIYSYCEEYLILRKNYTSQNLKKFLQLYYSEKEISIANQFLNGALINQFKEISCSHMCEQCFNKDTCYEANCYDLYKKIKPANKKSSIN